MGRKKRKLSEAGSDLGKSKVAKKKIETPDQISNEQTQPNDSNEQVNMFDREGMNDVFYKNMLKYLKWEDRCALRLVCWYLYNLVTHNDISFRLWNIYLDSTWEYEIPKLPSFFFDAETAISITLREIGHTRTRVRSKYWKSLKNLLVQVMDRIEGVDLYVGDLEKLKKYIKPELLHTIIIRDDDFDSFGECRIVRSLIKNSSSKLKILHLHSLEFLEDEAECTRYKLKHDFPRLESVILDKCYSSHLVSSILIRSNVCLKSLVVTGNQLAYLSDLQENMESLHDLEVVSEFNSETKAVDGIKNLLARCPVLKRLRIWRTDLNDAGLTPDNFQCLQYLYMINCTCTTELLQSLLTKISPQVETLGFDHCRMGLSPDFKCDFSKPLALYLYGTRNDSFDPSLWNIISMAPRLQALRTQNEHIKPSVLKMLKKSKLKEITLDSNFKVERDDDYPTLTKFTIKLLERNAPSLQRLSLIKLNVVSLGTKPLIKLERIYSRDSDLHVDKLLEICPNIEEMELKDVDIECETTDFPIHSLKKLEMEYCDFPENLGKMLYQNMRSNPFKVSIIGIEDDEAYY